MVKQAMLLWLSVLSICFTPKSLASTPNTYNVVDLGARPDGRTDSAKAFMSAWTAACGSDSAATVYVPPGRYLVQKADFAGKCRNSAITFRMDGTLVAPSDNQVVNAGSWILFHGVDGVTLSGGTLDGQGSGLWACKAAGGSCPVGAKSLVFDNSNNININGLTSLNSQLFHVVINGCQNVMVQGVTVSAPGNSPNTDGIHVQRSSGVTILDAHIGTGDDCVSIGPGTNNLLIEDVTCGPGHGISIGSLGSNQQEPGVQNVTVKTAVIRGTMNGVRIKTWGKPSNAFVKDSSGVKISDVTYQDIHGTSATEVGVKFDCSRSNPCSGLILDGVKLTYMNKPAEGYCLYAGVQVEDVQATNCLQS
ncbi:hypothetical protein RJ639_047543 [Escallonia herrerae]|uniref:Polygalacturonase n=1 Tax=Escallonia herrerae TaxID=1293975 RepID=A0AA88WHL3_9ASTE|nr:hypothetical protein RJ639_047543 [Escallonia herrerae]